MRFLSLFSGIGGFDLGFERAGMECIGQVENDKHCLKVLGRRWPNVRRLYDVKEVKAGWGGGPIGLVCGGFPCQDVSIAGRRKGLAGKRSGLWFEFHRILQELKPRWAIIENVPGLLSSNGGADFAVIIRGLAECGYSVCWRILDAKYFGVPQRRRRIFIVGYLGDGRAAEVLFETGSGGWHPAPRGKTRQEITGEVGIFTDGDSEPELPSPTLNQEGRMHVGDGGPVMAIAERGRKDGRNIETQDDLAYALKNPGDGGRSDDNRIAGAFGVRRLMPIECERLQGFPDVENSVTIEVCLDPQKNFVSAAILSRKSPRHAGLVGASGASGLARFAESYLNSRSQPTSKHVPANVVINCEEQRVEIHSLGSPCLSAKFVESKNLFHRFTASEDFALLLAGINTIAERTMPLGAAVSRQKGRHSTHRPNGAKPASKSGSGITLPVNGAKSGLITVSELLKYTTSGPSNIGDTERNLAILSSYVLAAISGYIPTETLSEPSFTLEINTRFGWTYPQADSHRYRQTGNAVEVDVADWLGQRIMAADAGN